MNKKYFLLFLITLLSSCNVNNDKKGEWKTIVVPSDRIISTTNEYIAPFNTSMSLKYFVEEGSNINLDNLSSLYINEVNRLHKIFDRHYSYLDDNNNLITNVKTINDSYGTNNPIKCSDELYDLIKKSVEYYDLTDGYFNIFTGSIASYWDDIFEKIYDYASYEEVDPYYSNTAKNTLESLLSVVPKTKEDVAKQLTFDDINKTITFNKIVDSNEKLSITVGGIAKGYATNLIKKMLLENGYTDGYLYSGGSSITTLSTPIYSSKANGQSIGVINPELYIQGISETAFTMKYTKEFSFSTSGNYTNSKKYRFIDNDSNVIYRHHIINPYTGYPMSYHRSVTISSTCFDAGEVDALSTAFMNMNDDDCFAYLKRLLANKQGYDLDLVLLNQTGVLDNAVLTVKSNTDFNKTLTCSKGIELILNED